MHCSVLNFILDDFSHEVVLRVYGKFIVKNPEKLLMSIGMLCMTSTNTRSSWIPLDTILVLRPTEVFQNRQDFENFREGRLLDFELGADEPRPPEPRHPDSDPVAIVASRDSKGMELKQQVEAKRHGRPGWKF